MRIKDVVVGESYARSRWKPMYGDKLECVRVIDKDASVPHGYGGSGHIRGLTVCTTTGEEKKIPARELRMLWSEWEAREKERHDAAMRRLNKSDALERHCGSIRQSLDQMEIEAEVKVWNTPALHIVFKNPDAASEFAALLAPLAPLSKYERRHLWSHLKEAGAFNEQQ